MSTDGKLLVYRASAGSGKTYQLALTYITLLLGYTDEHGKYHLLHADSPRRHREILAITFTNKATAEMRRRIIKELAVLAAPEGNSSYLSTFRRLLGKQPEDASADNDIHMAAQRALDSMLFDHGEIQISTIDAFFQRVLRSFAYEADLAGNYELSIEDQLMTQQAINDLLAIACGYRSTVKPKDINRNILVRRLSQLINNQIDKGDEYKIFNSGSSLRLGLIDFVKALSGEDYQLKREKIENFLLKPGAIDDFEQALKTRAGLLEEQIRSSIGRFQSQEISKYFSKYFNNAIANFAESGLTDFTEAHYCYFNPGSPKQKTVVTAEGKKKMPAEAAAFFNELELLGEPFRQLCTIHTLLSNIKYFGLFHDVVKVQQALKVHTNTVMLSDTNTLLNKIIGKSETPFIYERIGRQLRHYLIDEFQDTSRLQWQNLLPLLRDSLASNNESLAGYDGSLVADNESLIIGDVKQCIYRFRNSDPQLLARELERTPGISDNFNLKSLDNNWRSSKTIVDFNNRLFEKVGQRMEADNLVDQNKAEAYKTVVQRAVRTNLTGYVNVALCIDGESGAPDSIERMLDHIGRQLASGYNPGDITVLVSTNSEAKRIVTELFEAVGSGKLPADTQILSDEALLVSSAKSVRWIVSQLNQMLLLPEKHEVKVGKLPRVSEFDLDYINERISLHSQNGMIADPVEQAIEDFNDIHSRGLSTLEINEQSRRARASGQSLFEIVQGLIAALPVEDWKSTEVLYLNAFQDLVLDYSRGRSPSLSGFMTLWNDKLSESAAVGLVEGVNAIRVMTIHKSKGLEFKCVHLPFIEGPLDEEKTTRWYETGSFLSALNLDADVPPYFPLNAQRRNTGSMPVVVTAFYPEIKRYKDDQTIDRLNSLYVAFTRAERELIVTIRTKKKMDPLSAAGLLWPEIEAIRPQESSEPSIVELGEPTIPGTETSATNNEDIINIDSYEIRKRKNMWAQTRAANLSDSGSPI